MMNMFKTKPTLEKIIAVLMAIALASLLYRKGNFYNSFIPKPFETMFVLIAILALIDLLKNNRIKEFFISIPKRVLIAVGTLIGSVVIGWLAAFYLYGQSTSFNMVLEFGSFLIGVATFLLILFYTKNREQNANIYFYTLLIPVVYSIFILFPGIMPHSLLAPDGNFLGLTTNVNIVAKTLLIPAIFFITLALFKQKNIWVRLLFVLLSSAMVGLLFWISSRGALLSLAAGLFFVWIVVSFRNIKTIFIHGLIIFMIVVVGFTMTPYARKQIVINRILNRDCNQSTLADLKGKSLTAIFHESFSSVPEYNPNCGEVRETRFKIWPYYLNYVLKHPLGIGPNTHMSFELVNRNGEIISSGPHNTYMQIWLWGGLLGVCSFLYLLYRAFRNLGARLKSNFNPVTVALLGVLFTLAVSILFDDSLSLFIFWVVLALAIRNETTR
jgi:O-antigen ligase